MATCEKDLLTSAQIHPFVTDRFLPIWADGLSSCGQQIAKTVCSYEEHVAYFSWTTFRGQNTCVLWWPVGKTFHRFKIDISCHYIYWKPQTQCTDPLFPPWKQKYELRFETNNGSQSYVWTISKKADVSHMWGHICVLCAVKYCMSKWIPKPFVEVNKSP